MSPASHTPLDVLLASPDFPPAPGGIQRLVHRLVGHLDGCRIRVVTVAGDEPPVVLDAPHSVRSVRRGGSRATVAALNAAVLREGLRRRPDVVLSGHIVTAPAARALRALRGVPYVQYLYAREIPNRPRLTAHAVAGADATIAISRYTRDLALKAGAPPAHIQIIPPGVDLPGAVERAPALRPTIVSVARMEDAYKGQDVLLDALPRIRERVPGAQLVLVGDGRRRAELEARAGDGVVFAGSIADGEREAWLDRAQVFAMPSRFPPGGAGEGFGIVYLEASARGLPVVGGKLGGALDAVADGETGLLVDPSDADAVAGAIVRILKDEELARSMGEKGKEWASGFAWPQVAARVEAVLREVAR